MWQVKSAPRPILLVAVSALALLIPGPSGVPANASSDATQPQAGFSKVETLGLSAEATARLKQSLEARNYTAAEQILIAAIRKSRDKAAQSRLLRFLGGVYFLDHDDWGAAIAWNKAKAIAPLPPILQFSLAMAYIRTGHADWARQTLDILAADEPANAIYPYWIGRLDYDADQYDKAIAHFQKAIRLAPKMAQAYNNLGLCYYRQNRNALATASYRKAIELNLESGRPKAWPYLNLAVAENALGRPDQAEANLREAVRLDPGLVPAHFELGNILEGLGRTQAAIQEFHEAARLDPSYAEPHYELARIYRKLGKTAEADLEVKTYLRLHAHAAGSANP